MKTIAVRDLQKKLRKCVELAQKERVVVTRHGRPAVLLVGVEGQDWEDVVLQTSSTFWKMIEQRRREKTIPLAEARSRLAARRSRGKGKRRAPAGGLSRPRG
jgi:prevent-host-death family protein